MVDFYYKGNLNLRRNPNLESRDGTIKSTNCGLKWPRIRRLHQLQIFVLFKNAPKMNR